MVKEKVKDGKKVFMCEECRFHYLEEETAQKCEDFCRKNNMCSVEITEHSIERSK